ncbi:MAG: ATP-binding cassette domain-containing protein [Hyphomicrobiaceae bacterium]
MSSRNEGSGSGPVPPLPTGHPSGQSDCGAGHHGHHHVHGAHAHDHGHHHHHGTALAAPSADALVSARGLAFGRNGREILQNVDIDLDAREIVTLIGPNGAGKTTLVRLLLGLGKPDAGWLRRRPGLVVGYVPQRFERDAAIPMTVARFLTLGKRVSRARVISGLAEVGADQLVDRQLGQLSGGELQRVVLARALVRDPQALVLDEPAGGVDHLGEADLYTLIGRLRDERGLGVLLVSHDLHVVMAQSDRVICINRHVCCHGVPETVSQHPEYVRLFGDAARAFGIYQHHHDHAHGLDGRPLAARHDDPASGEPPRA